MNIKKNGIGCYVYKNDKKEFFNYEIIENEVYIYAWVKNLRTRNYQIEEVIKNEKIEKYRKEVYTLLQEISNKNENSEWINISQSNVDMYSEYKETKIDFLTSLRNEKSYPKFVFFLIIIGLIFSIEAHPLVYVTIFCMIIPDLKEKTKRWPIVALILNTLALLISIYIKSK